MTYMDDEQREQARQESSERAQNEPIPTELHTAIAELIEPHTMNTGTKHRDVMECIEVAYPAILAYLRDHPAALSPAS